jgi:hypothetical protein
MIMYRAKTRQGRFTEEDAQVLVDEVLLPALLRPVRPEAV